jgi:hypothetical protein
MRFLLLKVGLAAFGFVLLMVRFILCCSFVRVCPVQMESSPSIATLFLTCQRLPSPLLESPSISLQSRLVFSPAFFCAFLKYITWHACLLV